MKALIDADILRYEIGWGALTGWKAITETDDIPPFDYVEKLLLQRIASIQEATNSDDYCLYLTEGKTFRYDIATTKPYKGTRKENKPWHYDNLTAYMEGVLQHKTVSFIEADDALAIDAGKAPEKNIICTRDKDLRQVPGLIYSWELGRQAAFGPICVTDPGTLKLVDGKLKGTGFAFFCAQMLMGDSVDNIPGLPSYGPVAAYDLLSPILKIEHSDHIKLSLMNEVERLYEEWFSGHDETAYVWSDYLVEQGQLLWVVRELDENNKPIIWQRGMYE